MQTINGYIFDISKTVHLEHPSNKYWEVQQDEHQLTFRVGKTKDGVNKETQCIQKDYDTPLLAKKTLISKVADKLSKGYISKDANQAKDSSKKEEPQKKTKARAFFGQYYEKGKEGVKIEINDNRVKVTRIDENKKQKFDIRSFKDHQEAVEFCLKEEEWNLNQGYKTVSSKFIYSFVDDSTSPKTKKKNDTGKNTLSITNMTDEAISHVSRNVSVTKSDRSYSGKTTTNKFPPSKLGPPTSNCIKVLLAQTWKDDVDPVGWIMSEKLDGVRCFWTGSQMYSRNANRFFPPDFFTRNWPNSQLDGQLFIGRGQFSKTLSAVKKGSPIDSEWEKVRYLVFDCPSLKQPFKKRIKVMEQVIKEIDNPYIKCHGHRECTGFPDLFEELDKVNKIEGQGLMLRDPNSYYENRRSSTLLKVKTFHDDEAVVLGYKEGTGRCYGMVGALKVRNTHGVEFQVGSGLTDQLRKHPPKKGSKITYKYQEFNKQSGKPRFPTYLRTYEDKI